MKIDYCSSEVAIDLVKPVNSRAECTAERCQPRLQFTKVFLTRMTLRSYVRGTRATSSKPLDSRDTGKLC